MIIIIDTNILISALIRDSTVRQILINSGLRFYYPEASFHEVRKHKDMILEKSGLGDAEFERILGKILEYVALVPTENIHEHLKEARAVMGHIDPKDVAFLAAALSYEPSVIWSDDRDFERQDRIRFIKSAQFVKLLSRPYGRN